MVKAELYNYAFSLVGEPPASSDEINLGANSSLLRVKLAKQTYDVAFPMLIQSYFWQSAKRFGYAVQDVTRKEKRLGLPYVLPADCIRFIEIAVNDKSVKYDLVGRTIYSVNGYRPESWVGDKIFEKGEYCVYDGTLYLSKMYHLSNSSNPPDTATTLWDEIGSERNILPIFYVSSAIELSDCDSLMCELLAYRMAIGICQTMIASDGLFTRLISMYNALLAQNKTIQSQQNKHTVDSGF